MGGAGGELAEQPAGVAGSDAVPRQRAEQARQLRAEVHEGAHEAARLGQLQRARQVLAGRGTLAQLLVSQRPHRQRLDQLAEVAAQLGRTLQFRHRGERLRRGLGVAARQQRAGADELRGGQERRDAALGQRGQQRQPPLGLRPLAARQRQQRPDPSRCYAGVIVVRAEGEVFQTGELRLGSPRR